MEEVYVIELLELEENVVGKERYLIKKKYVIHLDVNIIQCQ
jgi:hypothetical protein